MDHVFRLIVACFVVLLLSPSPAGAARPADDSTYTLPANQSLPLVPADKQIILDVLLSRCFKFVQSHLENLNCHLDTNDIGQLPRVLARAIDNTLVRVYTAVICPAGMQPDFWEISCQTKCPDHQGLSAEEQRTASRRLRIRGTVTGIDSSKRVSYAPQSAGLGFTCFGGCTWVGGRLEWGPIRVFVESVATVTVGSPIDISVPHMATGQSCEAGENGAQLGDIETFPSEATAAGPGSPLNGSGGLSPTDQANLQNVSNNTGTDGILAGHLAALRQKLTATPGGEGLNGDCTKSVTCEGDAARCEMYLLARVQRCQASVGDRGDGGGLAQVGANLVGLGVGSTKEQLHKAGDPENIANHLNRQRFLPAAGCPQPLVVNFFGRDISFSFDPLCSLAPIMAVFLIAGASYIGLRIFLPAL